MVRRRISEAQRWQIIGMRHTTGMSFKVIGRQIGYHYTVVSWLVGKHTHNNNVKVLPRSDRPRVTSYRDDRALQGFVRGCHSQPVPYSNNIDCRIDICQQDQLNTLNSEGRQSMRCIKPPLLDDRTDINVHVWHRAYHHVLKYKDMRKDSLNRREQGCASCYRGRVNVWSKTNTAYNPMNIHPTILYRAVSIMV